MKKIFTLLCVAFLATSLFANVVTGTCGDNLQWAYDTDTKALTITGSGDMYWSYERPWEQVAGEITSVSLPNGLTSIGGGAFQYCRSLTSITIPNGVTSIGGNSFEHCGALSSISIPNSVISIEDGAFQHCRSLTSITIPNGVTSIKRWAFYDCSSLTEVIIPNSVTHIGDWAFNCCPSLVSITLPNSITTIEGGTFSGCNSLTSITIPNSVTSIGDVAFSGCSGLTSITIPNSVTSIGSGAFRDCNRLASVTIPSSVKNIGGDAFYDCEQVTMEGSTPPAIETSTFNNNAMILVPCSAMDNYLSAPIWQFMDLKGYNYKVNLTSTRGGNARITSAGGCASNVITIEATVTDGYYYYFKQWSDGNTDNPRTFTLTEDISIEAEFEPYKFYTFTLEGTSLSGEYEGLIEYIRPDAYSVGTIGFSGETQISRSVREGSVVTFSEQETGPTWLGWSDGITENGRSVVITSDTTISSVYGESTYYTIKISGSSLYGRAYDWYFYGETYVEFEALKGTEVYFREEGGCGEWLGWSDGSYDRERTIVVTSDTTITSRFDVQTYSVSITAGEGGYLEYGNIEREYNDCNRETIYTCAYAYDGYYFKGWSDGNTSNCIDLYPYEDITLVAEFAPKSQVQVLLGVDNASKGMGSVSGSGIFYSGDWVTITATPNSGYHFVEWSDGNGNATREIYLQSDTTLFATFAPGECGGKCGENLYWTYSDNTITITGSGDMDLNAYSAWHNDYDWYHNVTAVQFPEGITSIDDYAFNEMSLTSVVVPASVTHFGENAFAYNYNLTRFEYLGTEAECAGYETYAPILYSCYNLRYFKGQTNMLSYDNDYLDTVIITAGEMYNGFYSTTYIDNSNANNTYFEEGYLRDDVLAVETLLLPNGLLEIGDFALHNARHLEQITIPAGVTRIGESAFEECRSLESVTFAGRALRKIDDWAFYNCHALKTINIPEGVTTIGKAAFFDCAYLKEITLPTTTQVIADNAFGQCQKVAKMTVNAMTPPVVEAETFEDINRSIPLYVPIGTARQYKTADYWREFFNVIEYNAPSAVEDITAPSSSSNTQKLLRNGQLIILRDGVEYSIMGTEIN